MNVFAYVENTAFRITNFETAEVCLYRLSLKVKEATGKDCTFAYQRATGLVFSNMSDGYKSCGILYDKGYTEAYS
jgi:hypothetical protein